jgi:hypothetical protein
MQKIMRRKAEYRFFSWIANWFLLDTVTVAKIAIISQKTKELSIKL